MPDKEHILGALKVIAAMNTDLVGMEVSPDATWGELRIPSSAYPGIISQLRSVLHSAQDRLPPASELIAAVRLKESTTLQQTVDQFAEALAAAPPLCPSVALPGTPGNEDCRFWRDRSFRCRILRSIRLWSSVRNALLTDKLGTLIPGSFTPAQLVALTETTKTQDVFAPRTFPIQVPNGIDGNSTGHDFASAIWGQQPEVPDSCHFVPYEGP